MNVTRYACCATCTRSIYTPRDKKRARASICLAFCSHSLPNTPTVGTCSSQIHRNKPEAEAPPGGPLSRACSGCLDNWGCPKPRSHRWPTSPWGSTYIYMTERAAEDGRWVLHCPLQPSACYLRRKCISCPVQVSQTGLDTLSCRQVDLGPHDGKRR